MEAEKIDAATGREETLRKIAEQEKLKHMKAVEDAQAANIYLPKNLMKGR